MTTSQGEGYYHNYRVGVTNNTFHSEHLSHILRNLQHNERAFNAFFLRGRHRAAQRQFQSCISFHARAREYYGTSTIRHRLRYFYDFSNNLAILQFVIEVNLESQFAISHRDYNLESFRQNEPRSEISSWLSKVDNTNNKCI